MQKTKALIWLFPENVRRVENQADSYFCGGGCSGNSRGKTWVLEITSEMTQNKTHTQETNDTHTPARGTELRKLFALYYYKAPLGRIPDCMNKPFQYSAGAYMLLYSKRQWNSGLLQSLSRALITRRKCSLVCKGPLVSRLCPSPWQNILFISSTSPLSLLWPH